MVGREYWDWFTTKLGVAKTSLASVAPKISAPNPTEIKDSIVAAYNSQTTQLVKEEIKEFVQSPEFQESAASKAEQFGQGFSALIDVSPIKLLWESKPTRDVFFSSLKQNAMYLGSAVAMYGWVVKPAINAVLSIENPWLKAAVVVPFAGVVVYSGVSGYFSRETVAFFVDNTAFNLSLTKTASRATKHLHINDKCDHSDIDKLTGSLTSTIYNFGNYVTVDYFLYNIPVVGSALRAILLPVVYGQGLSEYFIAANGKCITCRYDDLQKNNFHSYGLGLALMLSVEILEQLLEATTGVRNFATYTVLSYVVYQYYILGAFKNISPLPGKEKGVDIFAHFRKGTESFLKQLMDDILPAWWGAQVDPLWLKKLKKFITFIFVKNLVDQGVDHFAGEDMHDLNKFTHKPSIKLFFSVQEQDFSEAQTRINALRQDFLTAFATYLHPSKKTRGFLRGIRSEATEKAMQGVESFFRMVYLSDAEASKEAEHQEIQQGLKALEGTRPTDILATLPPEPVKSLLPPQTAGSLGLFGNEPVKKDHAKKAAKSDEFLKKLV